MGENQPKAAGDALFFPGQRMHSYSFPHLLFLVAKLSLYKAAAIGSHELLDMTGHRVGVQLSPCPPSSRRLAPLSEESTRFSSGNCLIYVVLLPKPLQNNVLNAISL